MALKVSDIGEKELINYILSQSSDIIADDTAVTPLSNSNLISTCDMLIESKHFPEGMSYFDMGFKSVTVNVSDLAAMGADPLAFLLSIAVYRDLEVDDFKEIIKGVISACEYYGIPLIGGDTNEASEIIISGTALGLCDNPLMKNTSNEGDLICLTGNVGLAALGFELSGDNFYTKKASPKRCYFGKTGNDLGSRLVSKQVCSALKVFTSVFGMRTGVTPLLKSPVMVE